MTFAEAQELLERYAAGKELTEVERAYALLSFAVLPRKRREEMLDRWEAQYGRRKSPSLDRGEPRL